MPLDFFLTGIRKLPTDPLTGQITGKGVQIQRDLQPHFPGHLPVALNLKLEGGIRCHGDTIRILSSEYWWGGSKNRSRSPTAVGSVWQRGRIEGQFTTRRRGGQSREPLGRGGKGARTRSPVSWDGLGDEACSPIAVCAQYLWAGVKRSGVVNSLLKSTTPNP